MSATPEEPLLTKVRRRLSRSRRLSRLRRAAAHLRRQRFAPPAVAVFPEVVEEQTNVGPTMDALVTHMKRNQLPLGVDPDYDLLRENFDHWNFLLQAQALQEMPTLDPIGFFLRNGADAVNSPNYNFSMRNYLRRYPAKRDSPEPSPYLEWIERGRAAGEIADPAQGIEQMAEVLGLSPGEIVDELVATRTDMMERLRTGALGEMFAKAAEIEPLIGSVWGETTRTRMVPLGGRFVVGQVAAIHACQRVAGFRRARLVVVTDRPGWGGGRRFEGHLAHALSAEIAPDDIVVIYTDVGGAAPQGRFPAGVREIDFAAAAEGLPGDHKEQALVSLLRSFRADAIVNLDSRVFYGALTPYGKGLSASERIFLCFQTNAQRAQGTWEGRSLEWFYTGFDLVAGFITDSDYLRDQLTEMYQLTDAERARIHVLRAPVEPELAATEPVQTGPTRRPVVCWAGRWGRQKRVDIALEVARRMPDVDFRFWGEAAHQEYVLNDVPENARFEGSYGHISELDLSRTDAWLYTSAWDGVPSLLLEVAMTEVPIVGSHVGGVGEVISNEDSWPVAHWEDPEAYEKALREIFSDPVDARRRSHALRARLERDRSYAAYGEYAGGLLLERTKRTEERR